MKGKKTGAEDERKSTSAIDRSSISRGGCGPRPNVRRVAFIGGNERQARGLKHLKLPSDLELVAIHPAWSCNWNKTLAQVDRLVDAGRIDAIAISTDVPSLLGREIRRLARSRAIPWAGGRARGRGAILRLACRAADMSAPNHKGRRSPAPRKRRVKRR